MNRMIVRKRNAVLACLLLSGLCGCGTNAPPGKQEGAGVVPVKVVQVALTDLSRVLEYVGNIKGQDEALVYPKVSGKISRKVTTEGEMVLKGAPLLFVDRDEVGLTFEQAPVESPLNGTVGRIMVDIGENVTPQTAVAFVTDMTVVKILLDIPERHLPDITPGASAEVTVDAHPGTVFTGTVTKISPVVDIETRAAPIEITIDDTEHLLRSGMFARVKLAVERRAQVPVVLKDALFGGVPDLYVYVVQDNKAVLRKVTTGIRQGPYCEITSGVSAGDYVVIMGQQRIRDGVAVTMEIDTDHVHRK